MCSKYHLIKLESQSPDRKEDKIESLSSIAHALHTTTKQLISCRRKDENGYVINGYAMHKKMKNACAERAKLMFAIVKYANV